MWQIVEVGDGEDGGLFGPEASFFRRSYDTRSPLGQFVRGLRPK